MLPKNASLGPIALAVNKLDECEQFYNLLGMQIELKTMDYVYLTGNGDNISLHQIQDKFGDTQRLEPIGFALDSIEAVDQLFHDLPKDGFNGVTAHDNHDAMRLYDKVATQTQWKIYDMVVKPLDIYPAFMDGKL